MNAEHRGVEPRRVQAKATLVFVVSLGVVAVAVTVAFLTDNWVVALLGFAVVACMALAVTRIDRRMRRHRPAAAAAPPASPGPRSSLVLQRIPAYRDALRAYSVVVDGEHIGKVRNGESATFELEEGSHELRLFVDWVRSRPIRFEVRRGESRNFECEAGVRSVLYDITIGRGDAIQLREG
jgi:hypothetical protein